MGVLLNNSQYNIVHVFDSDAAGDQLSTITYSVESTVGPVDPDTMATSVHNTFGTHWADRIDSDATLRETLAYQGPTPSVEAGVDATPIPGTRDGANPPPQVCILVQKRTGFIGRQNRGRLYMPWMVPEDLIDELGSIQGATVVFYQDVLNAWLTDLVVGNHPMILTHSRVDLGQPREVTQLVMTPTVATQRRRLHR